MGAAYCKMLVLVVILALGYQLRAQPLTELRAVWVASVSNLDWPSGNGRFTKEQQQRTLRELLDSAAALNLNAIFLQIRPSADAFYPSELAPWSEYLTGQRGKDPGYDPLQFAIDEAHQRGLELHGWLNPYRFESYVGKNSGKPGDYNADHPDWMLTYSDHRIFDPGVPAVMQHLKEIVGEIVNNYDIDGIHFDDYFYSYSGTSSQDQNTFDTYGTGYTDKGDWRRDNINKMVAMVYDTIVAVKPHVRFGISPFGIYGNGQNPDGVVGLDAYNTIYIDPLHWLNSGTIDYVNPQLYWPTGGSQDFGKLLPWWAGHAHDAGRHVVAGHGIYRLNADAATSRQANSLHEHKAYFDQQSANARVMADPWTLEQITRQVGITRNYAHQNSVGGVFFRYQDFNRVNGLRDYLRDNVYQAPALMPPMTWRQDVLPEAPQNVRWEQDTEGAYYLTWDESEAGLRYVIYASASADVPDTYFDDPANIHKVLFSNKFTAEETEEGSMPYLFIKAYDRFGNLSSTTTSFSVEAPTAVGALALPQDGAENQSSFFDFRWSSVANAQYYEIEVSTDQTFATIDFSATVKDTTINATSFALVGEQTYYWRVFAGNYAGLGSSSAVHTFTTGFPGTAVLTHPDDGEELVALKPLISWEASTVATGTRLKIARGGAEFQEFNVVIDETLGAVSSYQVASELQEWTTYHLKIQLYNDLGEGEWLTTRFKTLMRLPDAPLIYLPATGTSLLEEDEVSFVWGETDLATGYEVVLSTDVARQDVVGDIRQKFSKADTTENFGMLAPGEYYLNVAGKNVGGVGEWAQVSLLVEAVLSAENQTILPEIRYDSKGVVWFFPVGETVEQLAIYDLMGKKMKELTGKFDEPVLLSNNLPAGIYVAVASLKGQATRLKFIKH
ncbi:uncharacterized lipoprotein YddW (UPF0748 family) [Marinoscillum furvescens DSM 4134]|uniref:Uncharacterized lipoprotein YddW (UPF0748 family) n=2 Tax=Marinoscillum furvescens TaxID=1026 RepID=A0A3D9L648_MARFU|nr:uncharacterized lipoprotein YddW (UPF0748 family) [Marinoscillum furvescens DSM 4134]